MVKNLSKHAEWLSLIEISGPFLTVSMLDKAFPQGLEAVETPRRQKLRAAYEEWREAVDQEDKLLPELHREWVRLVLTEMLEYDQESLVCAGDWPDELPSVSSQEHAGTFKPDWIVRSPADGKPRLFIAVLPSDTDLESVQRGDGWPVSFQERMTLLCRAHGVRVGLLTDGERWMLVNAPVGSTSSQASWYARLWFQEPITLKAFQSLLGVRRCFGPAEDTLESLLDESLKHHEEVTDTLGEQVRRAVEVLVQCLDKADEDRNRELLRDVKPAELYEAGLTVMMRLVFVLCAEERGLLLLGDSVYDRCYAVSTLRGQLAEEADRHGPEVLDSRHDAWARLLAVFRAVYGGIEHESLRMSALGGSLFDPDRFPFLEGRAKGTHWRDTSAAPLPIDNRTVLLLLNSLQILEQSGGALLLSYRALDVEQIGHVYEGLLEHTVARVPRVTLGLQGSQKAKNPNMALAELESARLDGEAALVKLVLDVTGRSESAIRNGLSKPSDDTVFGRVLGVCGGDTELAERIRPFTNLLRTNAWDDPIVYRDNSFMVTLGANRRETGTHYTPKSLTESIVTTTLEPVVYVGPAEGKPREEWTLKSSREILDLKVCDPAMGSGAFLVQACRYLGEKLVEAWLHEESAGKAITVDGEALVQLGAEEPLPSHLDERLTIARRLVAERCLYGVDVNPLAVELAKLSIWLVTLAKGRPFGFLDHNLRSGDSLLGIHRLEQLTQLRMDMSSGRPYQLRIFGQNIEAAVNEAIELRKRLRATTIRDIKDVEAMARLDREARRKLESVELIADAMIGEALRCGGNSRALDAALDTLATMAGDFLSGIEKMGEQIAQHARAIIGAELLDETLQRRPFHWIIEFPEVFLRDEPGFDGVVANPPWGAAVSANTQRIWKEQHAGSLDRLVDSFHLFILRAYEISRNDSQGVVGYLVPDVLLYQGYSQHLRTLILSKAKIVKVCNVGGGVFVRVTRPCCYIVFSKNFQGDSQISIVKWRVSHSPEEKNGDSDFFIKQTSLLSFPGCVIPTGNMEDFIMAAEYVAALPCKISDLVDEHGIQRGVSADNKDVFVVTKEKSETEKIEQEFLKPVVTGGIHIKPFNIETELPLVIYTTKDVTAEEIPNILKWVESNSEKITCKEVKQGKHPIYALHRPRDFRIFEKKAKILGVITSDRPKVAVDENSLYAMDGIYVFALRNNIDPYFLAGVLNSSLMAKIYRVFSQEEGRVMAQVKPTIIAQLPIVDPNQQEKDLIDMVSEISKTSKRLHASHSNDDSRAAALNHLDNLVVALFELARGRYERRQLS
ncbi:Eco57I restriction-modification methylase domain-containing protein [Methylomicrobium agile]|uniref:Eco57I restriction-modification methylase domain-containing protein n=1 Tax=Methylomicrobium agile TaxID=39774 RepID=UPI000A02D0C3|nr:N-6 DNA methylase [Methylomicrobium agile]